jgi:hypothetical protein
MADVITRFKLETAQFDSKLRDAAKGLKEYTHQAELGGKSFTNFSQKSIEAASSLGTIASGANNAKDKVKDLVGAYNEAAKAYNSLSQQQQQSDFGKALALSIGQLSDRLKEAKKDLYDLGSAAESVKGKDGLFGEGGLTGMLQVAGGNLIAQGIATLGSEIAGTVQQSIELARQGEGIRLAFDRLNQPGLLNNLKEATHGTVSELELMKAAIKFDNFKLPLEDLGTYLAFAQQKAQDTGDSVDNMVTSIVNGLGRQSVQILDNLGISASEIRDRMKEGGDMTQVVAQIIREEMTKAGDYVETAATRAARAAAEATDKMEALGREAMPVAEEWASVWNEIKIGGMELLTTVLSPLADSIRSIRELLSQPFEIKFKANIPNLAEGSNIDDNGNYIRRPSNGNWAGYDAANGRYYNEISSIPGISVTGTKPKAGRTGRSGGSGFNVNKIAFNPRNDKIIKPEDYIAVPSVWEQYGQEIVNSMSDTGDAFEQAIDKLSLENWSGDAEVLEFLKKFVKYGDDAANSWRAAGSAISTVGSAVSGLDDNAGKIMSIIGEAIANIAAAAGIATKKAAGKSVHWTEYVGAAAGIIATMVSAISTVHSATGYAEGGMVEGNTYSGDQIPIMANAGEVILNQAQQSNVAHALQGGSFGGMHLTARLDGKDLLLSIDRTGQTLGYGQLVFFH